LLNSNILKMKFVSKTRDASRDAVTFHISVNRRVLWAFLLSVLTPPAKRCGHCFFLHVAAAADSVNSPRDLAKRCSRQSKHSFLRNLEHDTIPTGNELCGDFFFDPKNIFDQCQGLLW
jgi:hypothetical protein